MLCFLIFLGFCGYLLLQQITSSMLRISTPVNVGLALTRLVRSTLIFLSMIPTHMAANDAFAVYSGNSNDIFDVQSIIVNPQGLFQVAGNIGQRQFSAKLQDKGQIEWFNHLSPSGAHIWSQTFMDGVLYAGGAVFINNHWNPCITKYNFNGGLVSTWALTGGLGSGDGDFAAIFPTSNHTLIGCGFSATYGNFILEFDTISGTVLSANPMTFEYAGRMTSVP
jgi:hypothetical protein